MKLRLEVEADKDGCTIRWLSGKLNDSKEKSKEFKLYSAKAQYLLRIWLQGTSELIAVLYSHSLSEQSTIKCDFDTPRPSVAYRKLHEILRQVSQRAHRVIDVLAFDCGEQEKLSRARIQHKLQEKR